MENRLTQADEERYSKYVEQVAHDIRRSVNTMTREDEATTFEHKIEIIDKTIRDNFDSYFGKDYFGRKKEEIVRDVLQAFIRIINS
jgi:hypothetical protein